MIDFHKRDLPVGPPPLDEDRARGPRRGGATASASRRSTRSALPVFPRVHAPVALTIGRRRHHDTNARQLAPVDEDANPTTPSPPESSRTSRCFTSGTAPAGVSFIPGRAGDAPQRHGDAMKPGHTIAEGRCGPRRLSPWSTRCRKQRASKHFSRCVHCIAQCKCSVRASISAVTLLRAQPLARRCRATD